MKKIIVIGGGLAGLTSSFYLSKNNYKVTLIESSPKLGGRTYSLFNEKQNDFYDNGHHLLMGCYKETLKLISELKTENKIEIQKNLDVTFIDENNKIYKLKSPKIFYPFNLLFAILNYKALLIKDRLKIIDFILDIACCFKEDLKNLTVLEWLLLKNQNDEAINNFWEILIVGTMNSSPDKASALIFSNVLKEIFFNGNNSSKFILTKNSLSEIFIHPIEKYLIEKGNNIYKNERVEKIIVEENFIKKIITNKNNYDSFDYVVFALPPHSISKINFYDLNGKNIYPLSQVHSSEFKYSSILNIHIWMKENIFKEKFYGLLNSEIHWIFNKGKHISITKSNSDGFINLEKDFILQEIYSELKNYFPNFSTENVLDVKIIKEKRATFIPDVASNIIRENIKSEFENLIIAGDWTTLEFPATIEGAIISGKKASQIIDKLN
ncbi:MAG: hydroxysqualene dehydroxylase HpnE [Melioribacteraceae bacterium]|nr:hydroxysqualene dehydroxylase HpnE [Melioribacteraceae bacterium]